MQPVPPPYVAMPMAILKMDRLRPSSKLVWAFLRNREQSDWTRLPQLQLIAGYVGLAPRSVTRAIRQLCQTSPTLLLLHTEPRGERQLTYYRTGAIRVAPVATKCRPATDKMSAGGRQNGPRSPDNLSRHTYKQEVRLPEKEERKGAADGPSPSGSARDSETATATTATATATTATADGGHDGDGDSLNPSEALILRHVFPHGCTRNQRACLMQAVVTGRRAGATYAFLANAATAPSEKTAPWFVLEEQVAKLRADAALAAKWFENPALGRLGAYYAALQREGAGRMKAWWHEYPDRLARGRWLFEWPKSCNVQRAK
ncbi:MAG: hypothetical protein NTY65_17515 [Planctomycetota bacterium]|nr:hypothetical protein [Planctomycetota bacterium]